VKFSLSFWQESMNYRLVVKMMIGFGECDEPREDTLELMELYVIEFISNVTKRSLAKS